MKKMTILMVTVCSVGAQIIKCIQTNIEQNGSNTKKEK